MVSRERVLELPKGQRVVILQHIIRSAGNQEQRRLYHPHRLLKALIPLHTIVHLHEVLELPRHGVHADLEGRDVIEAGARGGEGDAGGVLVDHAGLNIRLIEAQVRRQYGFVAEVGDEDVGGQLAVAEPSPLDRHVGAVGKVVGAADGGELVVVSGVEDGVAECVYGGYVPGCGGGTEGCGCEEEEEDEEILVVFHFVHVFLLLFQCVDNECIYRCMKGERIDESRERERDL